MPFVFIILLINIFKKVRFCRLNNIERIGHLTTNTERFYHYIRERHKDKIIICFYKGRVCNKFLLKKIKEKILIKNFFYFIYISIKLIPKLKFLIIDEQLTNYDFYKYLKKYKKSFLTLNARELNEGNKYIESKGIKNKDKIVCIYSRDSKYLQTNFPEGKNSKTWRYQNYRDADINTFKSTVEYLISRGYFVFRLGSVVNKKLIIKNKNFFDYATNGDRSDFLDIFLIYKCNFMIAAGGGLAQVAEILRKPMLSTNILPISMSKSLPNGLFITKKLIQKKKKLSYKEILNSNIKDFQNSFVYKKNKIKIINNTSYEILTATKEFINFNKIGKKKYIKNNLHKKYYTTNPNQKKYSVISKSFLKQNKFLLKRRFTT